MSEKSIEEWFVDDVLPLEAMLIRFLRRNWRDSADIPDLLQEVYARTYSAAENGRPAKVKPFVFMIARNLMIDWARRSRVVSIDVFTDVESLEVSGDDVSPERHVNARQELRLLQAAFQALPPRMREAVFLRRVEGLSQRETAERMGIGEHAIERHIARAMQNLADALYGTGISTSRRARELFVAKWSHHE